jgi:hypothetical protein
MKPKKPGDNISLKTKKNESPIILQWINCQTNLMDSIRYLIENEVAANGVRNLQHYIPADRSLPTHFKLSPTIPVKAAVIEITKEVEAAAVELTVSSDETKETKTEDHIDEDDIESWL